MAMFNSELLVYQRVSRRTPFQEMPQILYKLEAFSAAKTLKLSQKTLGHRDHQRLGWTPTSSKKSLLGFDWIRRYADPQKKK